MVDRQKLMLLEEQQRTHAAAARGAMHQVALGPIQPFDLLFEVRTLKIDIGGSANVASVELTRSADVEHRHFLLQNELLSLLGVDMLSAGFGILSGSCVGDKH